MWIKQEFRKIGNDATGELTVTSDAVEGFTFTKVINPTVTSEVLAYVSDAKAALTEFQSATIVKASEDVVVSE